jgi:hypothetical protein
MKNVLFKMIMVCLLMVLMVGCSEPRYYGVKKPTFDRKARDSVENKKDSLQKQDTVHHL